MEVLDNKEMQAVKGGGGHWVHRDGQLHWVQDVIWIDDIE